MPEDWEFPLSSRDRQKRSIKSPNNLKGQINQADDPLFNWPPAGQKEGPNMDGADMLAALVFVLERSDVGYYEDLIAAFFNALGKTIDNTILDQEFVYAMTRAIVHVGPTPPENATIGSLWYPTDA